MVTVPHLIVEKSLNSGVRHTQLSPPHLGLIQEVPHLKVRNKMHQIYLVANLLRVMRFGKLDKATVRLVSQDLHS